MTTMQALRTSALCVTLLLGTLAPAVAQTPDPAQPLPADTAVRVGRLPNGVTYYIRVNREPQRRAELRLAVNAGSVLEDEDQRGLAHFVEHMAFNGTRNFQKQELVSYLERVGMRFGPDINAYTSFDETVYMLTLPTDSAGVLETGVQILEDWAHGISFDSTEVEKERGVVIEEWRLGQGASTRMQNKQLPVIFRGSRYAERLPIGTRESLAGARRSALLRFYRDWYRPELMAVVAVGDFDPARMERLIRERFGRIPASPAGARRRELARVPDHAETLVSIAKDPEAPYTTVGVLWKQPARPEGTLGAYRQSIVERLYNGMLNDRLSELAQRPDPPFVGAGSGQGRLVRSGEVYQLFAQVAPTGVARGLEAVLTEAERVARHGFTPTELERQKAELLRAMERAYAEREKTDSDGLADEYVRHFLTGEPIPGIAAEFQLHQRLLPGITLAEVNRLAREWLTDRNRVVLVSAPDKEGVQVPDERALLAVFDTVRGKQIAAYQDATSDAPLLERPARPGRVASERVLAEGVREWRLSNGARVLLKPTDFKNDEVLFTAYSPGGASLVEDRDHLSATLAPVVLQAGGLGGLDQIELQKRLAGKAVRVAPFVGITEEGLNGSASPRDLETFFQLVHLYFTAPRVDSAAFESLRTRSKAALELRSADPEQAFADTVQVTMASHHPRARPFTSASLDEIDLRRAHQIYRDRFADAGDFTFVLVGSIDPAQLRPLVETYLATLPATGRKESWRDVGMRAPRGVVRKEVRRGVEPKAQTQLIFTGPFRYSADELYAMRALADLLRIRLREDLREDQGGTYGVGVSANATQHPVPEYRVAVSFGSAPERREALVARVLAQIDSLRRTPPGRDEVAKVQELHRRDRETSLRDNGYWMAAIGAYDRRGWDLAQLAGEARRIDALTPQVIQQAAQRLLDTRNYVHAALLPERSQ